MISRISAGAESGATKITDHNGSRERKCACSRGDADLVQLFASAEGELFSPRSGIAFASSVFLVVRTGMLTSETRSGRCHLWLKLYFRNTSWESGMSLAAYPEFRGTRTSPAR
jgi:hypothetical protein